MDISYIKEKCEKHKNVEIYYICLDCRKKMCPECQEEKIKHESNNHHVAYYKNYLSLWKYIEDSTANIKNNLENIEVNIEKIKQIKNLIKNQKTIIFDYYNNIIKKIESTYSNILKSCEDKIQSLSKIKDDYRKEENNIKNIAALHFKRGYDKLENLENIENRIETKLKEIRFSKLPDNYISNLYNNFNNINKDIKSDKIYPI